MSSLSDNPSKSVYFEKVGRFLIWSNDNCREKNAKEDEEEEGEEEEEEAEKEEEEEEELIVCAVIWPEILRHSILPKYTTWLPKARIEPAAEHEKCQSFSSLG